MITFEEAQELVKNNLPPPGKQTVALGASWGCVAAEDVRAPIPLPVFDNSAMDGFALCARDTERASSRNPVRLKILGTVRAGGSRRFMLGRGEACRIMTGGLLPQGVDTILPVEWATVKNGFLSVAEPLGTGNHVRRAGEEIRKGQRVFLRGALINPGTVALLASLGMARIKVFKKPRVAFLTTGSELVKPGRALKPGQIYDSNSGLLAAGLQSNGFTPVFCRTVADNPRLLRKHFRRALGQSDVVILMGGVSAGDYDFVKEILRGGGVRTVFWKVNQKPGKPLYFGRKGERLVFGLPGNPGAVFMCFYEYVLPALRAMSGLAEPRLKRKQLKISRGASLRSSDRFLVLRGKKLGSGTGSRVEPLSFQGSHMVSSLHDTENFILIQPGAKVFENGKGVAVDFLPHREEEGL